MTLIWPSLIILHSPTSKLVHTMLHFKNTSSDRSLSDILALFGCSTMPPWLKTLSTGALNAGMANVRRTAGISLSYVCHVALLRTQKSTGSESQSPSIGSTNQVFFKAFTLYIPVGVHECNMRLVEQKSKLLLRWANRTAYI